MWLVNSIRPGLLSQVIGFPIAIISARDNNKCHFKLMICDDSHNPSMISFQSMTNGNMAPLLLHTNHLIFFFFLNAKREVFG